MAISFDLSQARRVAAAASHYYEQATEPLYLDRVLTHHDLIYLREGAWAITEGETEMLLQNSTESSSRCVSSSMASARPSSVRRTSP